MKTAATGVHQLDESTPPTRSLYWRVRANDAERRRARAGRRPAPSAGGFRRPRRSPTTRSGGRTIPVLAVVAGAWARSPTTLHVDQADGTTQRLHACARTAVHARRLLRHGRLALAGAGALPRRARADAGPATRRQQAYTRTHRGARRRPQRDQGPRPDADHLGARARWRRAYRVQIASIERLLEARRHGSHHRNTPSCAPTLTRGGTATAGSFLLARCRRRRGRQRRRLRDGLVQACRRRIERDGSSRRPAVPAAEAQLDGHRSGQRGGRSGATASSVKVAGVARAQVAAERTSAASRSSRSRPAPRHAEGHRAQARATAARRDV